MSRRRDRKNQAKFDQQAVSATPWYYSDSTFQPKSHADRRAESTFFSEFSTESLFSDSPTGNHLTDPYEVLGLFPGASIGQVKKAHRKLAKQYHPDRFATAPEPERRRAELRMIQLNAAYQELLSRMPRTDDEHGNLHT